ncbi:MAG: hypothetical protein C5B52_06955 [Bacteroidetes bacterium]|nr:MAG: hypothetical protein C5B52_06955 [Bacteroidota bacterium]
MNVLIIENEKPGGQIVSEALRKVDEPLQVSACHSLDESMMWLKGKSKPDLVFMDIPFRDHSPFSLLHWAYMSCPIVFIAAYNEYLVQAFNNEKFDYLLKPIDLVSLKNIIDKYKNYIQPRRIDESVEQKAKIISRIVARHGQEFQVLKLQDIACFYSKHKLIFLLDKDNSKFVAEKNNLRELDEELDESIFFRANRQYIININFIRSFRISSKSKIIVELSLPHAEEIIVSQENASAFKKWINEH